MTKSNLAHVRAIRLHIISTSLTFPDYKILTARRFMWPRHTTLLLTPTNYNLYRLPAVSKSDYFNLRLINQHSRSIASTKEILSATQASR